MITLTSAQQAIVKDDETVKTFRVHFPNGEHNDLTNSDIVFESLRFSESLCSEQTLRFGSSEASAVEFEAVGIPNIYGVTIECSMTFTLGADSVVIPYGTFVVVSCPRTAGTMYRRKIQAYTFGGKQMQPSDYARNLVNYPTPIKPLRLSLVGYLMTASNSDLGLSISAGTQLTLATGPVSSDTFTWTNDGHTYVLTATGSNSKYTYTPLASGPHKMTAESVNYSEYIEMFDKMESFGATNAVMKNARNLVLPSYEFNYSGGSQQRWPFKDPTGSDYDSGYFCGANNSDQYVFIPDAVTAVLTEDGVTIDTYNLSGFFTNVAVTPYVADDVKLRNTDIMVEPTFSSNSKYMYLNAVDFPKLYEGFMELFGSFGQIGRDGTVKRISLSKSNPISISMSEYAADGCWWDEYTIEPIGTVRYTYYDSSLETEQTVDYSIGDGLSIYDMSGNALIKLLALSSIDSSGQTLQQRIEYLIDTFFTPAVQDVDFVPVDLEMLGMPYLEAGDYLVFDVGNGQTIGTYMMSRTLTGINLLMDSVESHGGEIITDGGRNI